jgi:hypothetical protein
MTAQHTGGTHAHVGALCDEKKRRKVGMKKGEGKASKIDNEPA